MQRVTNSPTQNAGNAEIQFYVEYPGGGTMSQEILLLIITEQLMSIATNTALTLTILTTILVETAAPPTVDNQQNAVDVILVNFQADQVCDVLFISHFKKITKYIPCRMFQKTRNPIKN